MAGDLSKAHSSENLKLAWRWLTTNREHKFKDYFRDLYAAYSFTLNDSIDDLGQRLRDETYRPQKPVKVLMPKPSGILRPFTLLSVEDQIVYQAYTNITAEHHHRKASSRYGKLVFGNLHAGRRSLYFYKKWEDSYAWFSRSIKQSFRDGWRYIGSFDLTACYDSIDHKVLAYLLLKYGIEKELVEKLISLLSFWSSDIDILQGQGIPQGPMASGMLAEVVLSYLDSVYEKMPLRDSVRYYRYVDDIRLMAKDEDSIRLMLVNLDICCKHIGLFPQSSKIDVHEIADVRQEIKSISASIDVFNASDKSIDQAKVMKKLVSLSPRDRVSDPTNFKRLLSFARSSSRLAKKLLRILDRNAYLYDAICRYLSSYERVLPDGLVDGILAHLRKAEFYQVINGRLMESIIGNLSRDNVQRITEFVEDRLCISRSVRVYDPLYRSMLLAWRLAYGGMKYSQIRSTVVGEENWWVQKTLVRFVDVESIGKPSYLSLLHELLTSKSVDVAIIAAHEIIRLNHKPRGSCADANHIAQYALKNTGIIRKASGRPSAIGEYLDSICKRSVPQFDWKKFFGRRHREAENKLARACHYAETDMSSCVQVLDVFDDLLLDRLYYHDRSIGSYQLGSIGGVTNSANSRLECKYPKLFRLCKGVHDQRLSCDLSHARKRSNNQRTRPVPYSYIRRLRPMILDGITELISALK